MNTKSIRLMTVAFFVLACGLRLLPHPPNFACIGALGLFAGCYLRGWSSFLLPIAAVAVSDWIGQRLALPGMGFYDQTTMAFVYGAFVISAILGKVMPRKPETLQVVGFASLSALSFFVISNFGVWVAWPEFYDRSLMGLVACYTAALPFFGYTLAGDLFFSSLLFGGYQMIYSLVAKEANNRT